MTAPLSDTIAVQIRTATERDRPLIDAVRMRRRYRDTPGLASSYDALVEMLAKEALSLAAAKLPVRTRFIVRHEL